MIVRQLGRGAKSQHACIRHAKKLAREREKNTLDVVKPANVPDDFPHKVRVDEERDRETAEHGLLDALVGRLEDLEARIECRNYGEEDERVVQGRRERRLCQVGEDDELDVVRRGDTPEERERDKERRPEEEAFARVDPSEHGERLGDERRQAGQGFHERREVARLGRHRDVDVLEGGVDVEEQPDGREAQEEVVDREVLDVEGQRGEEAVGRRVKAEEGEDSRVPESGPCADGDQLLAGTRLELPGLTLEAGDDEDADNEQDALDRSRERRQEERPGVELFPRADVKIGLRRDETRDGPPREAEVERRSDQEAAEGRVERVAAVIKELSELEDSRVVSMFLVCLCRLDSQQRKTHRSARARPPRLLPVDRVERLVRKQSRRERKVEPSRRAVVGKVGGAPAGQPGEEGRHDRRLGRGRREERVPRATLVDVQGFRTGRESRVVVQEREKVAEHERESLSNSSVSPLASRPVFAPPRAATHQEGDGVRGHVLREEQDEPVPERREDVFLYRQPVSSASARYRLAR